MATLISDPSGRTHRLQWTDPHSRDRRGFRFKARPRDAERIRGLIEDILSAKRSGLGIPAEAAAWLESLDGDFRDKLADTGLIPKREVATLKVFADAYVASRSDWSEPARAQFKTGVKNAVAFFGGDTRLDAITAADADAFCADRRACLAPATARKRARFLKHLFQQACRSRLLRENPFAHVKCSNVTNRERLVYVPADVAQKVADELTGEYRIVFILARFLGFRTPSETYELRWADVNFDSESVRVYAPKTKSSRIVPMQAFVAAELTKAHAATEVGAEFVCTRRYKLPVLSRVLAAAIVRAGVKEWPKPFQNLRASFATDCARLLPANMAAAVLGHGANVAATNYWQTTADDVKAAARALRSGPGDADAEPGKGELGKGEPTAATPTKPTKADAGTGRPRQAVADVATESSEPTRRTPRAGESRQGAGKPISGDADEPIIDRSEAADDDQDCTTDSGLVHFWCDRAQSGVVTRDRPSRRIAKNVGKNDVRRDVITGESRGESVSMGDTGLPPSAHAKGKTHDSPGAGAILVQSHTETAHETGAVTPGSGSALADALRALAALSPDERALLAALLTGGK